MNTHIFIYRHAQCDCKLWKAFWFYYVFGGIFIYNWQTFVSEVLYLYQTFTYYLSNQYTYTKLSTCPMWLQVLECPLILLGNFAHNRIFMSEMLCLYQTLINCVFDFAFDFYTFNSKRVNLHPIDTKKVKIQVTFDDGLCRSHRNS